MLLEATERQGLLGQRLDPMHCCVVVAEPSPPDGVNISLTEFRRSHDQANQIGHLGVVFILWRTHHCQPDRIDVVDDRANGSEGFQVIVSAI